MRISQKTGVASALMILLLFVAGGAGFYGTQKLSRSLDFITGPAWDAADGGMESTILLQRQVIVIDQITRGQGGQEQLRQLAQDADRTLERMLATNLIPGPIAEATRRGRDRFTTAREQLLASYAEFARANEAMVHHHHEFLDFMQKVEATGDAGMQAEAGGDLAKRWETADAAMEARIALLTRVHLFHEMSVGGQPIEAAVKALAQTLADLKENVTTLRNAPEFQHTAAGGRHGERSMAAALEQLLGEHETNVAKAEAAYRRYAEARTAYDSGARELLATLEKMEEQADQSVEGEADRIAAAKSSATTAILVALLLGLAVAIGTTLFTVRAVATPVARTAHRLRDIAEGEGDLRVQLEARGDDETAALAHSFNLFVGKIRNTVAEFGQTTRELAGAASHLASVADTTNETVQRERSETEQAATAMNEMAATVQEVASNTGRAAQAAQEASSVGQEGKRVVLRTIEVINALAEEIERAGEVVERLEQRSGGITAIMDVIRGIAEQTNLLALNAAIEAARAGEQGRGFAVVADEVRTLAGRTHQSTREIDTMLKELQAEADAAVQAMRGSRERAAGSVRTVAEAGEALERIAAAINVINDMNTQIASAAEEQSSVAEEMSRNLTNISSLSERTAEGAHGTAASSQQLSRLAGQLERLVGQFRV